MVIPPPFAIPQGQRLVYCFPSTYTASGAADNGAPPGQASISLWNGLGALSLSEPLAAQRFTGTWSNYTVPSILTGADVTIHSINPYMLYSGQVFSSNIQAHCGEVGNTGGGLVPGTSGSFNRSYYSSAGTNLSVIPTLNSNFGGEATLPIGSINDFITISFTAIAVYATIPYHPPPTNLNFGVSR